jgi:hypothetical protein
MLVNKAGKKPAFIFLFRLSQADKFVIIDLTFKK